MLRISRRNDCLVLEGRVAGPWVTELKTATESLSGAGPRALDLSGVSYVDAEGALLLKNLARQGVAIRERSAYIAEMLKEVAS